MKPEDFRRMLFQAMDGAMEAHAVYCTMAGKVADAAFKNTLDELADDELNHRDFLQGMMLKGSRALRLEESGDGSAADIPEAPLLPENFTPAEGILFAIRKELDAMRLFIRLSGIVADPGDKAAFLDLAKMEKGHKALLEDIYTNMTFPKAW